ncbi:hypothetical protein [Variovorax sp. GB1P17]|uniref:hypothetical protein n=1 Tax=Variovorax sp. GB1P17 TaxID=3443740 RepID=UPI003F4560D4
MAHAPSFLPEPPEDDSAESLALQACDDIDGLHVVQRAYACIEKLIVPQGVDDAEEVYPTRTELGALIRVVNEELQRCIAAADATVQALRIAVGEGGA